MAAIGGDETSTPGAVGAQTSSVPQQQPQLMPKAGMINQQQQPVRVISPIAGKARLQCHACQRSLEYDAGAQYVQCFSCSTMNAVQSKTQVGGQVLSMLCAICRTTNLAPYGINYVRCGSCNTISQVSHAYTQEHRASTGQSMQMPATPPAHQQRPQQISPQQTLSNLDHIAQDQQAHRQNLEHTSSPTSQTSQRESINTTQVEQYE